MTLQDFDNSESWIKNEVKSVDILENSIQEYKELLQPYQPTYDFDVYLGIRIMWNIIVLPMESEELMHPNSYIDAEIKSPWDLAVFSYNYDNQNQVEYLHIKRIEQYNSYK